MELTINRIGGAELYGRSISTYEALAPEGADQIAVETEIRKQYPTVRTYVGVNSAQYIAHDKGDRWTFQYHSEH